MTVTTITSEFDGSAFGSVCLSLCLCVVCLSVQVHNSTTIALIDLIFFTQESLYLWLGPP